MRTIIILIALASAAHAQLSFLGGNGPDGVCRLENGMWQCYPQQYSVPEPSSPIVLLTAAGAVLLMKRKRN
jgi:hypothetical protein